MAELFDMELRALRRDRAARSGPELFLFERVFEDCLERLASVGHRFERALLLGCPDSGWKARLSLLAASIDVRDPGPSFAQAGGGKAIVEDRWEPEAGAYDLVLAIGTLDTVNDLPFALSLIRHAIRPDGLFLGALSGGDSLPQLRSAMRAADVIAGAAAAHVHPRIEPAALAPLLVTSGFIKPVVDIDRVPAAYSSLGKLISDLRAMGATNILRSRAQPLSKVAREAAIQAFAAAGSNSRTTEIFEILHFAAWTAPHG